MMPQEDLSLDAPTDWEEYVGLNYRWSDITMKEVVYTDFSSETVRAIESVLQVSECFYGVMKKVRKTAPDTIEIVWYDDMGEEEGNSYVSSSIIRNVEERLQSLFGEHWRVSRKPDKRRSGGHKQRAIIKRADHQRFRYNSESDCEYQMILHGRPDGLPEGARRYGDLNHIGRTADVPYRTNFYLVESSTGTMHIAESFESDCAAVDVSCLCAHSIDAQTIVDGDDVHWYPQYLADLDDLGWFEGYDTYLNPQRVLGAQLCGRCGNNHTNAGRDYDRAMRRVQE